VRQLIVNADDLGLTVGVNRAIREAHADGIVTSATLMASGVAFADAIELVTRYCGGSAELIRSPLALPS